jgi:hypothetical protein
LRIFGGVVNGMAAVTQGIHPKRGGGRGGCAVRIAGDASNVRQCRRLAPQYHFGSSHF